MSNRVIKFRAWDGRRFHYFTALSGLYGVIAEHVEQFTGLHDKNGKEVYEGDIVRFRGGKKPKNGERPLCISVCVFNKGMFTVEKNTSIMHDHTVLRISEVIGNIHENTELL